MIPSFILTLSVGLVILKVWAEVAEQADAHDSKSCSFGIVGSIPTFGIITSDCGRLPAWKLPRRARLSLAFSRFAF